MPKGENEEEPNPNNTVQQQQQGGMARSPSHESFATDLSLLSLSSLGSEIGRLRFTVQRPCSGEEGSKQQPDETLRRSPNITAGGAPSWARSGRASRNSLLTVPSESYGANRRPLSGDVLFEEETEAIRSCGALSSVLGLMKSFSTSDITQVGGLAETLRPTVSEVALTGYELPNGRLEYASRSCSTWVAVGDVSSTSQLPSPQTGTGTLGESPAITATEFIRSVNKKVRQMYIRRRVLSTYKALERLTRSEMNLDLKGTSVPSPTTVPQVQISAAADLGISSLGFRGANKTLSLTVKDIEREKGKPLTKYQRNMMIFNWLQSLDENAFDQLS